MHLNLYLNADRYECASGVVFSSSKQDIGWLSSNAGQVHCIYFLTNTLGKSTDPKGLNYRASKNSEFKTVSRLWQNIQYATPPKKKDRGIYNGKMIPNAVSLMEIDLHCIKVTVL